SVMRVNAQSDSFSFRLEGTKTALQQLRQCYVENARAGTSTNPFGSGGSTSSSNSANPFQGNQGGQTASTTDAGKARSEGVDLFQSLLQDSRLAHFQVLRGSAVPEAFKDRDLAW